MNHFFALTLPPEAQAFVADVMERWRRCLPSEISPRWYAPADCHLTLRFLGDVSETRREELVQAAAPVSAAVAPFRIRLMSPGGFPNLQRPCVLWVGVENSAPLQQLVAHLDQALTSLGFAPERHPYRPHVTLARCRVGKREAPLPTANADERVFSIVQFALMQTRPPEQRAKYGKARYNIVQTFPLGKPHLSAPIN